MLTVQEYADLAGVSHKTIRGMIDRGELPAHRYGRLWRIDPREAAKATLHRVGYRPTVASAGLSVRPVRGEFSRRVREERGFTA
jgi:excisionase family DNA binding protein